MNTKDKQELEQHLVAISQILYKNTESDKLDSFKSIELTVRETILEQVAPSIGEFFLTQAVK